MWIYITHITGLKKFKMPRQTPRSCRDIQDPKSYQEIQDVKRKPMMLPRYSRIQDFHKILPRYSRCRALGWNETLVCEQLAVSESVVEHTRDELSGVVQVDQFVLSGN